MYRSGSTYLFNVFRRSNDGYWCYQEPFNEMLINLNGNADALLPIGNHEAQILRHPTLHKPYFYEFIEIKDALAGLFKKSFSFDDFFVAPVSGLPETQMQYIRALIDHARGRPVLQFCRSAGRIGVLKDAFPGVHIHLWREPRNQWWSFKVNRYFDDATQLVFNAKALPIVLRETKRQCGMREFHGKDIEREFEFAHRHPLDRSDNYFAFYALWLYSYLEAEKHADVSICIDRLGADQAYRATVLQALADLEVTGLDFSDCASPQMQLSAAENDFFSNIEHQVQTLFHRHGYERNALDHAAAAHEGILRRREDDGNRDAVRARDMALRFYDQYVEATRHDSTCWRVMAPFRRGKSLLQRVRAKLSGAH